MVEGVFGQKKLGFRVKGLFEKEKESIGCLVGKGWGPGVAILGPLLPGELLLTTCKNSVPNAV